MSETGTPSPLTTSVWHRPLVPEEAKDRLAKRQANAAVALLRLGREQNVWPFLEHRPDPRTRSYLIHRLRPLDAGPHQVLTQLDTQREVSIRLALILILGEFNEKQLPPVERERWTPRLLDLYANDPDPGIHGALAWTLRQWGRQTELGPIDSQFATGSPVGGRRWFVNRQGATMVIIPPPGEFIIGSPPNEEGREGGPEADTEMQRFVRIDHAFAIMSHQVTVAEFLEFRRGFSYRVHFAPETRCPINNVSWYDSVAYCNWLNEQEGVPREQWCYLPNEKGEYADGMTIVPDCLRRTGYRLPTEAEREFACRGGTLTSRYYCQDGDLDNHYTCNMLNSRGHRTAVVGTYKPNDLGLFDMLGNNLDWCHNTLRDVGGAGGCDPSLLESVRNNSRRELRGTSFVHPTDRVRAAFRTGFPPNAGVFNSGLRVSRTCAASEPPDSGQQVENSRPRLVKGSASFMASGQTRSCYGANYPPNFAFVGLSFRTARTTN